MRDPHDRTGVFRRHLFQTISADTRLAFLKKPASTKDQGKGEPAPSRWRPFLEKVCEDAAIDHCADRLAAAATDLGVGVESEIYDFARDLAKAAGLKRLEEGRFLKAVASAPLLPLSRRASRKRSPSPANSEDPFGLSGRSFDSM